MTTKIMARGRNGYFQLDGYRISTIEGVDSIEIGIHSNRIGKSDPITIKGPIDEVKGLFKMINEELESIRSN